MSEVITRQQAQEIIAVLSRQKDKHYSSVVAAGSDLTKEALLKTAVGVRLEDKKASEISIKDTDNDDQFVTKDELKATIDELLTSQANIDEAAIEQSLNGKDINTSDFTKNLVKNKLIIFGQRLYLEFIKGINLSLSLNIIQIVVVKLQQEILKHQRIRELSPLHKQQAQTL